jgi:hypothetical protein
MKKTYLFFIFLLFRAGLYAQISLLPSITSKQLPLDSAHILPFKPFSDTTGKFEESGLYPGTVVPEFTLGDTAGNAVSLSDQLATGKPLFIISISYSCPWSREAVTNILSKLVKTYKDKINFCLVYILEAHPTDHDNCPYMNDCNKASEDEDSFNKVNTMNNKRNIIIDQQKTYGERKATAKTMIKKLRIATQVLIDGVNNEYWNTFGPSPNNGYLITPQGTVFSKYGNVSSNGLRIRKQINMLITAMNKQPITRNHTYTISHEGKDTLELNFAGKRKYRYTILDSELKELTSKTVYMKHPRRIVLPANTKGLLYLEIKNKEGFSHIPFLLN